MVEILEVTENIRALMFSDYSSESVKAWHENGILTMWEEESYKILLGQNNLKNFHGKWKNIISLFVANNLMYQTFSFSSGKTASFAGS